MNLCPRCRKYKQPRKWLDYIHYLVDVIGSIFQLHEFDKHSRFTFCLREPFVRNKTTNGVYSVYVVDGRFFGNFFGWWRGQYAYTLLICGGGYSHVGVTHMWRGHSCVGVTHMWNEHSHVGVTHMWRGHSRVGGTHMCGMSHQGEILHSLIFCFKLLCLCILTSMCESKRINWIPLKPEIK